MLFVFQFKRVIPTTVIYDYMSSLFFYGFRNYTNSEIFPLFHRIILLFIAYRAKTLHYNNTNIKQRRSPFTTSPDFKQKIHYQFCFIISINHARIIH